MTTDLRHEPLLGPDRYVLRLLAPGAAAVLAFDGYVRELGSGWVDLTPRIATSAGDDWVPISMPPKWRSGAEVLSARGFGWRAVDVGAGDLLREQERGTWPRTYRYWLFDGEAWHQAERLSLAGGGGVLLGVVEGTPDN